MSSELSPMPVDDVLEAMLVDEEDIAISGTANTSDCRGVVWDAFFGQFSK